jgi:hypothetical protein
LLKGAFLSELALSVHLAHRRALSGRHSGRPLVDALPNRSDGGAHPP